MIAGKTSKNHPEQRQKGEVLNLASEYKSMLSQWGTWNKKKNINVPAFDWPCRPHPWCLQYSHLHGESEIQQSLPFGLVGKRTRLRWLTNVLCKLYNFKTLGIQVPERSCPRNTVSHKDKKTIQLFDWSFAYHGREISPFCQTTRNTWEKLG